MEFGSKMGISIRAAYHLLTGGTVRAQKDMMFMLSGVKAALRWCDTSDNASHLPTTARSYETSRSCTHTIRQSQRREVQHVEYSQRSKTMKVTFTDGRTFSYPAEYLRVYSPAATAQSSQTWDVRPTHTASGRMPPRVVHGRKYVGIMGIEVVGRYALKITFDDLHATGLYTWDYLYALGESKYSNMKAYVRMLHQHGLQRYPSRGCSPQRKAS